MRICFNHFTTLKNQLYLVFKTSEKAYNKLSTSRLYFILEQIFRFILEAKAKTMTFIQKRQQKRLKGTLDLLFSFILGEVSLNLLFFCLRKKAEVIMKRLM